MPDGSTRPVRDLEKISLNYLKTEFPTDFVAIIPFQLLSLKRRRENLFFLVKIIRLLKGLRLFQVSAIMKQIKKIYNKHLQALVDSGHPSASSKLEDNTKIMTLLLYSYTLGTLRLVMLILNISYFLGIFWYILCVCEEDFVLDVEF